MRYEPEENPPLPVSIGAGLQAAALIVTPIVLTVVIVARIAEQSDDYLSWAVFAALVISGATTILQVVRVGRIGSGYVLIMGTSAAFIAVCVAALIKAGPATMASLIIVSSLGSIPARRTTLATTPNLHPRRYRHRYYAHRGDRHHDHL